MEMRQAAKVTPKLFTLLAMCQSICKFLPVLLAKNAFREDGMENSCF